MAIICLLGSITLPNTLTWGKFFTVCGPVGFHRALSPQGKSERDKRLHLYFFPAWKPGHEGKTWVSSVRLLAQDIESGAGGMKAGWAEFIYGRCERMQWWEPWLRMAAGVAESC